MARGVSVTSLREKVFVLLHSRFDANHRRFGMETLAHATSYREIEKIKENGGQDTNYETIFEQKKILAAERNTFTFINQWLDGTTKTLSRPNLHALAKISDEMDIFDFQTVNIDEFINAIGAPSDVANQARKYPDLNKSPLSMTIVEEAKSYSDVISRRYGGLYWEYRHSFTACGWFIRSPIRINKTDKGHVTFDRITPYTNKGFTYQHGNVIPARENLYLMGEDQRWSEIFLMVLKSDPEERHSRVENELIGVVAHVADREQFPVASTVYLKRDTKNDPENLEEIAEEEAGPFPIEELENRFDIKPHKIQNKIPELDDGTPHSLLNSYIRTSRVWPVEKYLTWTSEEE